MCGSFDVYLKGVVVMFETHTHGGDHDDESYMIIFAFCDRISAKNTNFVVSGTFRFIKSGQKS
jgi:hypothetical protein